MKIPSSGLTPRPGPPGRYCSITKWPDGTFQVKGGPALYEDYVVICETERPDGDPLYADSDGEALLTREDAAGTFDQNQTVTFYNEDGERFVITRDVSAT